MTLDLASIDTVAACDKGAEIELRHPVSNVGLGVYVTVLGKDSSVFKAASREITNARIRREAQAAKRGRDADVRTVEDIEKENIGLLVTCTKGWSGVTIDGVDIDFTPAAATKLYSSYPWIYDQVNEGIGQLENFIQS